MPPFSYWNNHPAPSPISLPILRRHVVLRRPPPSPRVPDLRRRAVPIPRRMHEPPVRLRRESPHIDRLPARLRPPHRVFRLLLRRQPPVRHDHLAPLIPPRGSRRVGFSPPLLPTNNRAPGGVLPPHPYPLRQLQPFRHPRPDICASGRRIRPTCGAAACSAAISASSHAKQSVPTQCGPVTGASSRTTHPRPRGNTHAARGFFSLPPCGGGSGWGVGSRLRTAPTAGSVPARHCATSALNRRSSRRMRYQVSRTSSCGPRANPSRHSTLRMASTAKAK